LSPGLGIKRGVIVTSINHNASETLSITETAAPANPTGSTTPIETTPSEGLSLSNILLALGVLGIVAAGIVYFFLAYIRHDVPKDRSFDLLISLFTFALPLLSAFVLEFLNKLNLSKVTIPTESAAVAALDAISMTTMVLWFYPVCRIDCDRAALECEWWKYGIILGVFTILYTTVFYKCAINTRCGGLPRLLARPTKRGARQSARALLLAHSNPDV
jgi:hypothetical protein